MPRSPFLAAFALGLAVHGCYLSHQREPADASPERSDARRDVGVDARVRDAPIGRCERLGAGPSVLLEGPGGVTPRLVALDGGEVGVVYVSPGGGDPTAVRYERLGADLGRLTGPVLVATDSWTWAEPARLGSGLVVAFGSTTGVSTLLPVDLAGAVAGGRIAVDVQHPEILRPTARGLFWLGFESRDENAFVMVHLGPDGAPLHPAQRIGLGRYGSGFGVAARPDGHGHVIAYPSEGPPGARRARVNAISDEGVLTGERTLGTVGADAALPVFVDGMLFVVWRTADELAISQLDTESLEPLDERSTALLEGSLFTASIEGHFVVGAFQAPRLTAIDLGDPGALPIEIMAPRPGYGGSISWVDVPGGLAIAAGLVAGSEALPWVARIECTE